MRFRAENIGDNVLLYVGKGENEKQVAIIDKDKSIYTSTILGHGYVMNGNSPVFHSYGEALTATTLQYRKVNGML